VTALAENQRLPPIDAPGYHREDSLGRQRVETLREVARDRTATILYDEIDLGDGTGLFAHRLLFDPRDELTIDFHDLNLSISPRTDPRVLLGPGLIEEDGDQ
jgi:hypothetical protein